MSIEFFVGRLVAAIARLTWLSPAVLLFLSLHAPQVLARSGGGEHFDSGAGSSSPSSGGGDSIIVDLVSEILWQLIIHEPQVGIPLTLAIAAYIYWNRQTTGDASTRKAIDRAESARRTKVNPSALESGLKALRTRDGQFSADVFLARVRREFAAIQEAWFRRDLEPVRRYLSDATFQRLMTQLHLLAVQGVRDAIADLEIDDVQIIRVGQNAFFDSLQVRVSARLRDADAPAAASDKEARALARRQPPEAFTEVWTFVRKPGVRSQPGHDLSQGNCPSCGAPFAGGATNTCSYCGAIVNSGHYDWVLAEITQGSQYQPAATEPPGLAKLRQRDPALSMEVLEDRASLLFWKWVEAQSGGDATRLAKVASPVLVARLGDEMARLAAEGQRKLFLECAVGAVDTLQFVDDGERSVAAVAIRWSARMAVVAAGVVPASLPSLPQRHVLLLERRVGARTGSSGMATNRCPSCAAPLTDNGQPTCEFCGCELAAGDGDWVLRDLLGWEAWRTQGGKAVAGAAVKVPDHAERERLLYLMVAMAKADGAIDQKEAAMLRMAAGRWGIDWVELEQAMNAADDGLPTAMVKGSAEAEGFLLDVVRLMRADGRIDAKEKKLLKLLILHLGFMPRQSEFLK